MSTVANVMAHSVRSSRVGRWVTIPLLVVATLSVALYPRYRLVVNTTNSLTPTLFFVDLSKQSPQRGDHAVFLWRGGAGYERGTRFIKVVQGVSGQSITVEKRTIHIDGQPVARALERSPKGTPLDTIAPQVISSNHLYVTSYGPNAFDSRYALFGLIELNEVVGTAWPLF